MKSWAATQYPLTCPSVLVTLCWPRVGSGRMGRLVSLPGWELLWTAALHWWNHQNRVAESSL